MLFFQPSSLKSLVCLNKTTGPGFSSKSWESCPNLASLCSIYKEISRYPFFSKSLIKSWVPKSLISSRVLIDIVFPILRGAVKAMPPEGSYRNFNSIGILLTQIFLKRISWSKVWIARLAYFFSCLTSSLGKD